MRKAILAILLAATTVASADDTQDQNVYEFFRKLPDANVKDEEVTAKIKRHMASLLYPVNMARFIRPEEDASFRELIIALQKQMGVPSTGMLTFEQFDRLAAAARDIEASTVGLLLKTVSTFTDSYVSARGTLAGDNVGHKLNFTQIECFRAGSCSVFSASIDPDTSFLWLNIPATYEIKVWSAHAIVAVGEGPCIIFRSVRPAVITTLTVDIPAETVTLSDTGSCLGNTPNIFNLVDGFPIAGKYSQEKANKARMLVYEPAQRLIHVPRQF